MGDTNGIYSTKPEKLEHRRQLAQKLLLEGDHFDPETKQIDGLTPEQRKALDDFMVNGNLNHAVRRHMNHSSDAAISRAAGMLARDVVAQAYIARRLGSDGIMTDALDMMHQALNATKMTRAGMEMPDWKVRLQAASQVLDQHRKTTESLRAARVLDEKTQGQTIDIVARMVDDYTLEELDYMRCNGGQLPPGEGA